MPEFLELLPPPEALAQLLEHLPVHPEPEEIDTVQALGRVTAAPVTAPHPLPSFPRTTVDGYAVRAGDTFGASDSLPAYLQLIGEIPMGAVPGFSLAPAQCALIHTGGMLPDEADSVVMVEHTQSARPGEVEVLRAVASGENVLKIGEDVMPGDEVIPAGVRMRPAEIGGLMALGITKTQVSRRPRVGIISSGDEVVPPEKTLGPGQVRDVNAYTLSSLVEAAGGQPVRYGIVSDQEQVMREVASKALAECDVVVITAGSSASARDLTSQVINSLGKPGVLAHGVNVRPGKPTILAVCEGKAVIGLPGNPVSALVIAWLFVNPVVEALLGLHHRQPHPSTPARLALNLSSQAGREDWIPVRLLPGAGGYQADPVFGKSNLIFSLARADGLVRIPADATGLEAGEQVEVYLF
ncbi:MAG: molybdopterin molybdenumtransferase MoeA [Chloroflexi bacterium RBG_16_54_18]|nr:MAG: molybdopterin molybdenumtransferase MoeA [Chloroflexi bacterium RBG_16_54_18]